MGRGAPTVHDRMDEDDAAGCSLLCLSGEELLWTKKKEKRWTLSPWMSLEMVDFGCGLTGSGFPTTSSFYLIAPIVQSELPRWWFSPWKMKTSLLSSGR
ncbi:hypothetical protein ACLOJK_029247 [Asimina triloba]